MRAYGGRGGCTRAYLDNRIRNGDNAWERNISGLGCATRGTIAKRIRWVDCNVTCIDTLVEVVGGNGECDNKPQESLGSMRPATHAA